MADKREYNMEKHILIVDDDKDFSEIIADMLESYGYRVTTAADGESGGQGISDRIEENHRIYDNLENGAEEENQKGRISCALSHNYV